MNAAAYASLPACFPEINLIENRNPTIEYAIIPIISIIRFHILSSKKLIPVIDKELMILKEPYIFLMSFFSSLNPHTF